mmetsp:Transcript_38125/g.89861  ORF Transcript_38125/g.89861 Transcript_38125/m.89861 type:complete len:407 (+) Transcript_38125:838-2058(+)
MLVLVDRREVAPPDVAHVVCHGEVAQPRKLRCRRLSHLEPGSAFGAGLVVVMVGALLNVFVRAEPSSALAPRPCGARARGRRSQWCEGVGLRLGGGPRALHLDAQVHRVHPDPEKAVLAPVVAPGVAPDPVLGRALLAPADDGDLVVEHELEGRKLVEHAARIRLELLRHVDPARNRPASNDLGLHLVGLGQAVPDLVCVAPALDVAVLLHVPPRVVLDWRAGSRREVRSLPRHAGLADAEGSALHVDSLVVLARLIRDPVGGHVVESGGRVPALAGAAAVAVDQHLRSDVDLRECIFAHDGDPIGHDRCRRHGPAASAIVRDVLVSCRRQEVLAVLISPEEPRRKFAHIHHLVRPRADHPLTLREDGLCDAAVRGIGSGSIEVDGSRQSERAECRSEEDGPQHAC